MKQQKIQSKNFNYNYNPEDWRIIFYEDKNLIRFDWGGGKYKYFELNTFLKKLEAFENEIKI